MAQLLESESSQLNVDKPRSLADIALNDAIERTWDHEQHQCLVRVFQDWDYWVRMNFRRPIENALGVIPAEIQQILDDNRTTEHNLGQARNNRDKDDYPILKRAINISRLSVSNSIQERIQRTTDYRTQEMIESELKTINFLINEGWYKDTEEYPLPKLTDFLTIREIEKSNLIKLSERIYDEKFAILQCPQLFSQDLDYWRKMCQDRGIPICVAYIDIDHFKDYNDKYNNSLIDSILLPRFMNALEAIVYSRGFAYRFGGDEYIVLLPNTKRKDAKKLMKSFQKAIQRINYPIISREFGNPTVSIGIFKIPPYCCLTNKEIESLACKLKNEAKENGRNCIKLDDYEE